MNNLTHLLTLKADFNKLTQIKLEPLPYLQHASFTNNRIRSTEGISHPKLEHLNLNSMIEIDFSFDNRQQLTLV